MMDLQTLQNAFQRFVLDDARDIENQVDPGRHDNRLQRLSIYYDAYRLRLAEALNNDYPALAALMEADDFRAMCFAYVEATGSTWRNVRWYGGGVADFLARTSPWAAKPALSECAQFEWTLTLAFDAADDATLTFDTVAALPADAWQALRLTFHPSAHVLRLHGNAGALRTATDTEAAQPSPTWSADPVDWLVWRKGDTVRFRSLPGLESIALHAAREGASFPEICAALLDYVAEDKVAPCAAGFLRAWLDDELIAAAQY